MALNMNKATYGRDKTGQKKLQAEFENDFNNAIKALSGDDAKFVQVCKAIKNNWSGADADKFLQLLDEQRKQLVTDMKQFKNTMSNALAQDRTNFESAQSKNAQTITSNIKIK